MGVLNYVIINHGWQHHLLLFLLLLYALIRDNAIFINEKACSSSCGNIQEQRQQRVLECNYEPIRENVCTRSTYYYYYYFSVMNFSLHFTGLSYSSSSFSLAYFLSKLESRNYPHFLGWSSSLHPRPMSETTNAKTLLQFRSFRFSTNSSRQVPESKK